jgi:hypothetical protein
MAGVVKRNLAAKYNRIEQKFYENYLNGESQAAFPALLLIPLFSERTTANREIQEPSPYRRREIPITKFLDATRARCRQLGYGYSFGEHRLFVP